MDNGGHFSTLAHLKVNRIRTYLMDEDVWTAVGGCDKAPSFRHIEPLAFPTAAGGHRRPFR